MGLIRSFIAASVFFILTQCGSNETIAIHEASGQANEVTIRVSGLDEEFSVLYITDTHISIFDENEAEYQDFARRMDKAYPFTAHYATGDSATPAEHFVNLLTEPKVAQADLIILGGDIVNNPSKASVSFIQRWMDATGIPFLYTSGNHDWHYEGMAGSLSELRQEWIEKSLKPLYSGRNPLYYQVDMRGINFVVIDNSTYQITEDQLAFFERQLERGLPVVLVVHIPMYHPKYAERGVSTCGDPRWGAESDRNWELEKRERWYESGNLPSTIKFAERVKKSPYLIAVLCGHLHRHSVDEFSATNIQYVTAAGAYGHHRMIRFKKMI